MQVTDGASILERVTLVRGTRSGFLHDIEVGAIGPDRVADAVASDPALSSIYAVKVAEAFPGLGKVTARRALARHGIDELSPAGRVAPGVWSSIATDGEPR